MKKLTSKVPYTNALILLAMAALVTISLQPWAALWDPTRAAHFSGLNFFSYFTVQSNIIAVVVYILAAFAILRQRPYGDWFRFVRGGAVLYMLVTGVVYALLLHNNPAANPTLSLDWNNFVLHYLNPIFIVGWWLLWPSAKAVSPKEALLWLIFPIAWIIYTLVRASFVNWYPYPFLDPAQVGGIGGVAVYVLGISLVFVGLSQLFAWISRERKRNNSLY